MALYRTPEKSDMDLSKGTGSEGSEGNGRDTAGRDPNKAARRNKEAKDIVANAKLFLSYSGNLRRDVKQTVTEALDELLQMIIEGTAATVEGNEHLTQPQVSGRIAETQIDTNKIEKILEFQANQIQINNDEIVKLRKLLENQAHSEKTGEEENNTEQILEEVAQIRQIVETTGHELTVLQNQVEQKTYANIAATPNSQKPPEFTSYHSLAVTSKNDTDTGDQILEEIRKEVNATEKGIQVDRIRKAKNRKVIVSCRTEEGKDRVLEKLQRAEGLEVEEIYNKDPLIVLKDVIGDILIRNSYQDIEDALKRQNKQLLQGLKSSECAIEVIYTKKARNLHTRSIVARVAPKVWQRFVQAGAVHLDLQRVRVADQSPLVQCSLCLGYGHSKRFCKETQARCSHCAGLHMKTECADFMAEAPPTCTNCLRTKQEKVEHNAFSEECPVRRKWDVLARASVSYC